ncbi:MAG: glycosyltransferase, partial [Gemmatimonadaceae bacterium]|nr:glycosyltransferase [Gemmatimonadaceae bacterium]
MTSRSVFHDPSGRRGRRVTWAVGGIMAVVALLAGSFAVAVWRPADVTPLPVGRTDSADARAAVRPDAKSATAARLPACRGATCLTPAAVRATPPAIDPIVAAFAVQWDPGSRAAIARIGDRLDWVIVEGAFLGRGAPGALTITLDPDLLAAARARDVRVHLMVTNYAAGAFDPQLVESLVRTPERRARAVADLAQAVRTHGLGGVTFDFERLRADAHANVLSLIAALRAELAADGAVVSVAVPVALDADYPIAEYGRAADYVVPMLYDEHAGSSDAGPIAGRAWFEAELSRVRTMVPPARLLVGVGQYGYHWRDDRDDGITVSVSEAMALGRAAVDGPRLDRASGTPHAAWRDAQGVQHRLWYLDAVTLWNQVHTAMHEGDAPAGGVAIWRLGSEDETLWRVLGRRGLDGTPALLESLPARGVSVLTGDGEVLAVEGREGTGRRALAVDATGRIVDAWVATPPGGYVVTRAGAADNRVALTFDDGPDPAYTGAILDTLASRKAIASFFVIGRQVQQFPALTRRITDAGHEIGNHTFSHPDLAGLSETAVHVELATAGRVIEAVTGHRPLLFRPPYIGDARPATEERLRPMAVATSLGLRTAGLEVDTRDWQLTDPAAIVRRALDGLSKGRTILLHDGGGDRTATVAAVGPLVDSLRARGYTLTTVAGLLGVAPDAGSPVVAPEEAPTRWLHVGALTVATAVETAIVWAFLAALVLGSVRVVTILVLAGIERSRVRVARRAKDAQYTPSVSIVVPAYNEARVIARTVRSLRALRYASLEIVVVDDGSTDETFTAAQEGAEGDARVRCLRQPNGGKASALNTGIACATGEVIVVVDADTVLADDAIAHLVHPLADARVGAVAGNAKVGNRVNLVTRWQSV